MKNRIFRNSFPVRPLLHSVSSAAARGERSGRSGGEIGVHDRSGIVRRMVPMHRHPGYVSMVAGAENIPIPRTVAVPKPVSQNFRQSRPTIPMAVSHIPTWHRNGHFPPPDRSRNPVRGKEIPPTGTEAAESETDCDLPYQGNSRCLGSEKFFIRIWIMAIMAAIYGMLTIRTRLKC
jgi:hypothetical protein